MTSKHRITVGEELRYDADVQGLRGLSGTYAQFPGNDTVFLGDSITLASDLPDGTGGSGPRRGGGWPAWASMLSGQRLRYVRNAGVFGNTSAQMLARFDTDVTPYAPKVVTLMCGTNDTGQSVPLATIAANIRAIVAKIKTIGARPVLFTCPPTGSVTPSDRQARVAALNAWIRRYATASGIPVIDAYALWVDPATGSYQSAYDGGDTVHPGGPGYLALASAVAAKVGAGLLPEAPPMLCAYNGDTQNLVANGLFLTGTAASPTSWSYQNATSGITKTYVTGDAAVVGTQLQLAAVATSGVQFVLQTISSMTAGHVYRLSARVKVSGVTGGTWSVLLRPKDSGGAGLGDYYPASAVTQAIDGVIELEFTAPVGTVSGQIQIQVASGSTMTFQIGQVTLYDLTAMGVTTA